MRLKLATRLVDPPAVPERPINNYWTILTGTSCHATFHEHLDRRGSGSVARQPAPATDQTGRWPRQR